MSTSMTLSTPKVIAAQGTISINNNRLFHLFDVHYWSQNYTYILLDLTLFAFIATSVFLAGDCIKHAVQINLPHRRRRSQKTVHNVRKTIRVSSISAMVVSMSTFMVLACISGKTALTRTACAPGVHHVVARGTGVLIKPKHLVRKTSQDLMLKKPVLAQCSVESRN